MLDKIYMYAGMIGIAITLGITAYWFIQFFL